MVIMPDSKNTQEQPNGRDVSGKVCGKGQGAPMSSSGVPPSQHRDVFTNSEALPTPLFYGGSIM